MLPIVPSCSDFFDTNGVAHCIVSCCFHMCFTGEPSIGTLVHHHT